MKEEKISFSTLILILSAILPVAALLIINAFQIPREQILLRTYTAFASQFAFGLVALVLIKNKLLKTSVAFWIVSLVIWRIYNLFEISITRPFIGDVFFTIFYVMLFVALYKEFGNKIKYALPFFILFLIPVLATNYISFISKLGISFNSLHSIFDSVLISASLTAMMFSSLKAKGLSYLMVAVASSTYLWQIRAGTYYIASWVEIISIIGIFILTLLYRD